MEPETQVTPTTPPPPKEMIDIICMQLRGALTGTPCPDSVLQAGMKFIEALEKWAQEG